MKQEKRGREQGNENLKEDMERDTEIRRDSQVRGSMGVPPSGGKSQKPAEKDEAIPEFGRLDDEDRISER